MAEISRRRMLRQSTALLSAAASLSLSDVFASSSHTYQIGACDWSIGMHSDVEAMAMAQKIGLDGVQVSLGKVENHMHLRQPEVQAAYRKAAERHGVQVSSLAIGELNQVPYKSAPETEAWVSDSIDVAHALQVPVVLLAFFGNGDLKGDKKGTQEVISRLKKVAPKAEEKGITLGIESWLSADEHLEIIEAVGSPNVRVYYDVANSNKMGYDIYEEMQRLGTRYICEVHAKENDYLLGEGRVDFPRVRNILQDVGYTGWIIIEGATPQGMEILPAYRHNLAFIQKTFNQV
jgi:sugar phosphate isomerase/epimerase